ncbi:radical SAM family heme chaperone HemW [bacterium]|nr:radical SAM family heme chaperone HemW [bacterium]
MRRAALYLHFPYCRSRCTYCDFNAYTDVGESRSEYIEALVTDIRRAGRWRIHTVFCGGGTPSLYSAQELGSVLQACRESFDYRPLEVTLEANPGTVSAEQLHGLRQAGFDRISLGVQTFRPELLTGLNRIHSVEDVSNAVHWARKAGFENLSLDLIYGLPGQTLADWKDTVDQALSLRPDHISVYQLTVEPGTRLEAQLRQKEVTLPPEERVWKMDRWMRRHLKSSGLRRYEVSNWARPGRESRHNLVYWKDLPYLGLGCGATGFINGWRVRRLLHPHAYQQALIHGALPVVAAERRDLEGGLRDCLMMGLRVRRGISLPRLLRRFPGLKRETLEAFFQGFPSSWWSLTESRLRLRGRGVDFVSTVCEELMDVLLIEPALTDPGGAQIEDANFTEVATVISTQ